MFKFGISLISSLIACNLLCFFIGFESTIFVILFCIYYKISTNDIHKQKSNAGEDQEGTRVFPTGSKPVRDNK